MPEPAKTSPPELPLAAPSLWPVLQRLAGGTWPPEDGLSATRFVEAAVEHGLLPLLLREEACPPAVASALERYRVWENLFRRRAEKLAGTVRDLIALLDPEPFILLKGADYARRLYPEPTLRPMQDIDILVPTARFAAVCARLHEAGLGQRFEGSPTHRVAWFGEAVFDLGDVTLEVHHSFLPRARHPVDYDAVWRRRVPVAGAGGVARLDDVDAFVYHALSLAKDEFFVRLARYVDFWLLLRTLSSLGPARERAREWRATHALFGALSQIGQIFPEVEERHPQPARGLLTGRTSRFLERFVLPPGEEGLRVTRRRRRGLQIWRKFWLMDSSWRRIGFALQYVYAVARGSWLAWRAAAAPGGRGRPGPGTTTP